MRTIECSAIIDSDHRALVQLPADVSPGEHRILVLVDDAPASEGSEFGASTPSDVLHLIAASQSSLAFWDNPVDDEIWNRA